MWLKRVLTAIIFIATVVLQTTLFQAIAINNVSPNVFIIIIVSISALRSRSEGAVYGVLFGLAQDIFYGSVVGYYVLIYVLIAIVAGFLYRNYYPNSIVIPLTVIGVSDLVYNLYVFLTTYVLRGSIDVGYYLVHIYLPELTYTVVLSIVLYRFLFMYSRFLDNYEHDYRKGEDDLSERHI